MPKGKINNTVDIVIKYGVAVKQFRDTHARITEFSLFDGVFTALN